MINQGRPTIDLTRTHFTRTLGEFTLHGSWVWNESQESYEPALVVVPAFRKRGFQPCVVALSAAYKYDSPAYCAKAARLFVKALGMEDGITRAHTLATLIYDHLLDLLKMPESPEVAIIVGEAVIDTGAGKKTLIISDFEPMQQL